jgi:hypothetical protein
MLESLFVVAFVIPVIGVGQTVLSLHIIRRHKFSRPMFVYLGLLYASVVVMGILIGLARVFLGGDPHNDFIRLSDMLICPTAVATLLSFLTAMILSIIAYLIDDVRKSQHRTPTNLVFLVNAVLIPSFLMVIPALIVGPMETRCNMQNRQTGDQIVAALESHRQEYGAYPIQLEDLIPGHVHSMPQDHCDPFDLREYRIKGCSSDVVLLTIETMSRGRFQRYNLQTRKWSESPLPVGDWTEIDKWDVVCNDLE